MDFVKEHFVPLAVDARSRDFNDAEAEFLRQADCVTQTAAGSVYIVTAAGHNFGYCSLIADGKSFHASLQEKLNQWRALPDSATRPNAVAIGPQGPHDPKRVAQAPPDGCLIVRVYNRHLGRNAKGALRYALPSDYLEAQRDSAARFAEPANDILWITQPEWESMLPAQPQLGQTVPMPPALALRLLRHHLDPARGFGESENFHQAPREAGQFELTVDQVSAQGIRIRLEGQADLAVDRGSGYQQGGPLAFKPSLLGYLTFDPQSRRVTAFELLALGEVSGRPLNENDLGDRPGTQLLGIAFELVSHPTPADLIVPRGARDDSASYLGTRQ